jgi:hypothetical protein
MRPKMSVVPPAENGMINLIGFVGQLWAWASVLTPAISIKPNNLMALLFIELICFINLHISR